MPTRVNSLGYPILPSLTFKLLILQQQQQQHFI